MKEREEAMIRPLRVAHVVINVTDMEQAQRFYCDGLGMSATGSFDNQLIFLYFGETGQAPHPFYHDLALYKVGQPAAGDFRERSGVSHVALRMNRPEDVDAAAKHLQQLGFPALKGPGVHREDGYRYVYIQDPDRNVIELVAPTRG